MDAEQLAGRAPAVLHLGPAPPKATDADANHDADQCPCRPDTPRGSGDGGGRVRFFGGQIAAEGPAPAAYPSAAQFRNRMSRDRSTDEPV